MNKVAVIILNFKVKDSLVSCLESVFESTHQALQVIVVDNNSQDGIEQAIQRFKDVEFVQSGDNLGYTGGNNKGIEVALRGDADFIFILNPDTELTAGTISKLLDGITRYKAGIVGPKIYFSGSKKIWYAGGQLDLANVLGSHRGVDEVDRGQYDTPQETDYITGAAFFAKRELFEKIGLFDDRFFLYYEDSDLSFRAKRAGYKLMYIPQAIVYHENAKSTGLGSPLQDYYITRNRMLFAKKFLPFRTQFALLREALRNIQYPVRRKAFIDFLLGRFGKGKY
jgi:GT2 family glycosyltransferase